MNKALALEVARELNMSPEKVYEICKSFHDGFRSLLNEPDKCKAGIMIEGFVSLKFRKEKLEKAVGLAKDNKETKQAVLDNIQLYKRNDSVKKKQTKEQDHNA